MIWREYILNYTEKLAKTKMFQIFASLLLIFSMLTSAIPPKVTFADETNIKDGHGEIANGEEKDEDEAKINKQVSFSEKPGEYFIDLTVEGKDLNAEMTTDIVIPYDLSNSMQTAIEGGSTRAAVAKDALADFLNGLLDDQSNQYRVAFVPYGTSIMDGNTISYLQRSANPNGGGYSVNSINPYNYYVGNFTNNADAITSIVPGTANHGNHGGTFTQQALERAGEIMATSNADRKI